MTTTRSLGLLALLAAGCGKSTADLAALAHAEDPATRIHAVHELRGRAEGPDAAVPVLIEKLKDENVYVRRDAARALGQFGPAAGDAVPYLRALLRDREPGVRRAAAQALGQIDPAAVPARPKTR